MSITKEDSSKIIGNKVRQLRLKKNMTLEFLAMEANMEYKQLSRIELGKINTTVFQIIKLAKALEVNAAEIIGVLHLV
jgi:transcriptional regulator with XRE-family HTH domain